MRISKFYIIPFIVIFITTLIYLPTVFFSSADNGNSCASLQKGHNNNNNCNQQNQSQGQDQTQNNNQNVNITLNQPVPQQQVIAVVRAVQLPKTGDPTELLFALGALTPLGIFLRKSAKKNLPFDPD